MELYTKVWAIKGWVMSARWAAVTSPGPEGAGEESGTPGAGQAAALGGELPTGRSGCWQRNAVIIQTFTWQGTQMKWNFSDNFIFCFLPEAQ